jgi:hypothetical protein
MATLVHEAMNNKQQNHSLQIIAKSLFKELKTHGYEQKHIVSLCSELLGLVITDSNATSGANKSHETASSTPDSHAKC